MPNPRSQRFMPVFSSNSFIVLHFNFRPIIHSELIFRKGVRCSDFDFYPYEQPVVPAPFVEKTVLPLGTCPSSLARVLKVM